MTLPLLPITLIKCYSFSDRPKTIDPLHDPQGKASPSPLLVSPTRRMSNISRPAQDEILNRWNVLLNDPLLSFESLKRKAAEGELDKSLRSLCWRVSPLPLTCSIFMQLIPVDEEVLLRSTPFPFFIFRRYWFDFAFDDLFNILPSPISSTIRVHRFERKILAGSRWRMDQRWRNNRRRK